MNGEKALGVTTLTSLLVVLIAFYYNNSTKLQPQNELQERLGKILEAMNDIESSHKIGNRKVAVGYGGCQDLFVKGSHILQDKTPPSKTAHYGYIENMDQLMELYAMFFSSGSAVERFVSNVTLFRELVKKAEESDESYYAMGGNAPVMAKRFEREGLTVILGAKRDKKLLQGMGNVTVVGSDSSSHQQDIHLIFEYAKGDKWGNYVAPRANRFIIHNDNDNPTLGSVKYFEKELDSFRPHLMVIGGLQMMDNFPYRTGEREAYLKQVKNQLKHQPASTLIHFEMASFSDIELLRELKSEVLPYADSLGMNEQELPNLYSLLKFNNVSIISEQNPRIAQVLDSMREIYRYLELNRAKVGGRKLSRIHVHTLAFQAIMVDQRGPWKNTKAAATKAALVAHRHVCSKEKVKVHRSNLLMDEGFSLSTHPNTGRIVFDDLKPVSCWLEEGIYQICIAPVLVCTKVKQTAGGGDNISAAGLVLQI